MNEHLIRYSRVALVVGGLLLLALNFFVPGGVNFSLSLVFFMLGAGFFLVEGYAVRAHHWWAWLLVPAVLLCVFGLIFLLNVITGDWNAWAYAWLLLIAGAGLGVLLTARQVRLHPRITMIFAILCGAGLTLFALFGAIVGGLFIQVMAPILLVAGGLALYFVQPRRARLSAAQPAADAPAAEQASPAVRTPAVHVRAASLPLVMSAVEPQAAADTDAAAGALIEPLTGREREVLRLLAEGCTNADIAARLVLAPSTVKTHLNNLYGKLGAQGRVQALNRARELGLIQ